MTLKGGNVIIVVGFLFLYSVGHASVLVKDFEFTCFDMLWKLCDWGQYYVRNHPIFGEERNVHSTCVWCDLEDKGYLNCVSKMQRLDGCYLDTDHASSQWIAMGHRKQHCFTSRGVEITTYQSYTR